MTNDTHPADKYGSEAEFAIVEAFHSGIKRIVAEHLQVSGEPWQSFVFGSAPAIVDAGALASLDARLLELGHRYESSALVSLKERPEAYKAAPGLDTDDPEFSFSHPQAPPSSTDDAGRILVGLGDNVVGFERDIVGTARYVRSSERVLQYLNDGVPADTIAIIDDSGGTLTAPILEQFAGVICAGGTVRSHLGILTREYGIPCLMNAKLAHVKEGQSVMLETTAAAKTAEAYQQGVEMTARIWRLGDGAR